MRHVDIYEVNIRSKEEAGEIVVDLNIIACEKHNKVLIYLITSYRDETILKGTITYRRS
jgi:hypothetical protein